MSDSVTISRPIAPDLIEITPTGPRLVGGKRKSDGRYVFPYPKGAEEARYEKVLLGTNATLWGWTVQRFRPGSPPYERDDKDNFQPFVVGFVEIAGEVIVETRIEADPSELRIGQPMTITTIPFSSDTGGVEIFTYAYRPLAVASN